MKNIGFTTTLNELFEKDMKAKNYLRESTKHNYVVMWDGNVRDGLGKMKVCNIKSVHIRTFYANLESEGIGHNTIKFLHNMIRSALEVAVHCDKESLSFFGSECERLIEK